MSRCLTILLLLLLNTFVVPLLVAVADELPAGTHFFNRNSDLSLDTAEGVTRETVDLEKSLKEEDSSPDPRTCLRLWSSFATSR